PPVAPTWHRPDCPPGLEALILRLLEKDANKRPASATEVHTALASLASHPSIPTSPLEEVGRESADNPLYRRVFVGREREVRQLQAAFDAALSGKGALAMVVGEPGIGKTAVCEQLATYVTLRGGRTLTGHCYEEGSLALPYLAFVEALRGYAQIRPTEELRKELGTAASDVARIVSEVRERLAVEPRPPGDPEEDRWRLLEAVSGFLRNASTVQPLLLVLEDLHWADQGTLDLLVHLARNLQGARLLVIGTYRDVEVDRSHPLSATLAELRRGAEFGRVLLRGLGTPEVQRMLVAITGAEVPGSLAESIHRQTEGPPEPPLLA
ncbi:MAG TPA: AAA family ATPase, partial [Dehalococcoidia bacterium]|nr:AAA family ATPase [Dehalococcoidia bacterium]